MSKAILYKNVWAMPGTDVHKALTENNPKKAEEAYQDAMRRYRELMEKANK